MAAQIRSRQVRLTSYPRYQERGIGLDHCPWCSNAQITRTPRRNSGPTLFHCKRCGFIANHDEIYDAHRLLGHVAV